MAGLHTPRYVDCSGMTCNYKSFQSAQCVKLCDASHQCKKEKIIFCVCTYYVIEDVRICYVQLNYYQCDMKYSVPSLQPLSSLTWLCLLFLCTKMSISPQTFSLAYTLNGQLSPGFCAPILSTLLITSGAN